MLLLGVRKLAFYQGVGASFVQAGTYRWEGDEPPESIIYFNNLKEFFQLA